MTTRGAVATLIGCLALAVAGLLLTPTLADDRGHTAEATGGTDFTEPSGQTVSDGTYLGYVRSKWPDDDDTVAVDFVSLTNGVVRNEHPEVLLDAGLLARIDALDPGTDLFDSSPRPFRITIRRHSITAVQSADDILDPGQDTGAAGTRSETPPASLAARG